jgi:hypothetical protein
MLYKRLGYVPVKPRKTPLVLFDRQRRIDLLWELFLVSLFMLLLFVLVVGCVR